MPASTSKFLEKSRGLTVDTVVYDLEDSVAPDKKAEARKELVHFLNGSRPEQIREIAVRINSIDSGYALDDLTAILQATHLDAVAIPKVQSAADMQFVTDILHHLQPKRHPQGPSPTANGANGGDRGAAPIRLLPLIESAKGLMNLSSICSASPYISGLVFAAEDFCLDLDITRSEGLPELLYARSQIVATAHAFSLPSVIDLVCTSFRGEDGQKKLAEESDQGKRLGFNGKQCIHPAQVEAVQKCFAPGEKEVEWAVRVSVASKKADEMGKGAWSLDGEMIDVPVILRAKRIVQKAKLCDIDVGSLEEKHKGEEPQ